MSPILRFVTRLRPADLILPAGAALVSAGLQQLVDREDRQRRRLAALDELVEMHRSGLAAAGVDLSDPVWRDEAHPLDIELALQTMLARTPTEPEPAEPRPRRRGRRLALAGLALGAVAAAIAIPRAGFLQGLSLAGLQPTGGWPPAVDENDPPTPDEPFGPISSNSYPDSGESSSDDAEVIGRGEPPAEACGWPACDWTSDATRSVQAQRTAAAIHRNECVFRPANAVVRE